MFVKYILDQKMPDLIFVSPVDTVRKVAKVFKQKQIGFALVKNKKLELLGTVSERDIIHAIAESGDVSDIVVADIMTTKVVKCAVDDTLESVRQTMTEKRVRHILAMDADQVVGLVSIGDLIKHSLDECRIDSDLMVSYINGEGYQ